MGQIMLLNAPVPPTECGHMRTCCRKIYTCLLCTCSHIHQHTYGLRDCKFLYLTNPKHIMNLRLTLFYLPICNISFQKFFHKAFFWFLQQSNLQCLESCPTRKVLQNQFILLKSAKGSCRKCLMKHLNPKTQTSVTIQ